MHGMRWKYKVVHKETKIFILCNEMGCKPDSLQSMKLQNVPIVYATVLIQGELKWVENRNHIKKMYLSLSNN